MHESLTLTLMWVLAAGAGESTASQPAAEVAAEAPSPDQQAEVDLARGERLLYETAHEIPNLEKAIWAFDAALKQGKAPRLRARAQAMKAMALLRVGDLTTGNDAKIALFERGQKAADAAIASDKTFPLGHYAKGANLSRVGQTRGVLNSLFMVGDIRKAFEAALAADPDYAEPRVALGKVDEAVPGMLGGSRDRAEKHYREALRRDPHYTRGMLDLAQLLANTKRQEEAVALAKRALGDKKATYPGDWRKFDQPRARELLATWAAKK